VEANDAYERIHPESVQANAEEEVAFEEYQDQLAAAGVDANGNPLLDAKIKDLQLQLKNSQSQIEFYEMALNLLQKQPSGTIEVKDGVIFIKGVRIAPSDR
jgi:hypothetical protein